jgi:hypothetical protein
VLLTVQKVNLLAWKWFSQAVQFALKFADEDDEDNEIECRTSARPHRISDISLKPTIRPVPEGSAFFIFSNTNR